MALPEFIISTRFGVGVTDHEWFRIRFRIFEAIPFSSLMAQTDQNFHWLIFVGDSPLDWVVDDLKKLLEPLGGRASIMFSVQRADAINKYAREHVTTDSMVVGLLDDDDAWTTDTIAKARRQAEAYIGNGEALGAFTYQNGTEWLMTDLLDLDALFNKNNRIVRKASIYNYTRPFHSMSCFHFCPTAECIESVGRLHSSMGEAATEAGGARHVIDNPEPAWLYSRHHLVDSALHKAHKYTPLAWGNDELARRFGVNQAMIEAYQNDAQNIPYARKRTHGEKDKSSFLIADEILNKQ